MMNFKVTEHDPQYQYHCECCKFSWCCGYVCSCIFKRELPDPPITIQRVVNEELKKVRLYPQFNVGRTKGRRR